MFRDVLAEVPEEYGIDPVDWTPYELRPTFVSLMSEYGQVPIEQISQEVGHRRQATTETVCRHQLKPRRHVAGRTMDKVIGDARKAS